jgi:branched-chain amino acid transport system permease protein
VDRRVIGGLLQIAALIVVLGAHERTGSGQWQGQAILLGIFVILTVSLNLASGFTGLFSLGHIGFMAIGAYSAAILTLSVEDKAAFLKLPDWLAGVEFSGMVGPIPVGWIAATIIGGLIAAVVALLVGSVIMRLSGSFVAVATLGFLVIVRVVLINAEDFTRGSRTFSGVHEYTDMWWTWGWAVLVVYVVWRLKRSPWGRQMLAQRADRWAAQSVGIPMLRPRLLAFVVSAFFCGVAGSLYAHHLLAFSPQAFYFDITFTVITMLVVGGLGSVTGSVLGAATIVALSEGLRRVEDATLLYGIGGIALGLFFLAVIILRPDGIMGDRELSLGRFRRALGRERPPDRDTPTA